MNVADYKSEAGRHIIVYGEPKVGKTVATLQLAMYGYKLWVMDGEDGIKSAFSVDKDGKRLIPDEFLKNIELIRLPDNMLYPIMAETVLKIVKGGECKVCHIHGKVSCPICSKDPNASITTIDVNKFGPKDILVGDSVTQLGNSFISQLKKKEIANETTMTDLKLDWDEWQKQGFLLDRVFSIVQTAKWNSIWITHEEFTKMKDKSENLVPRMGTKNNSAGSAKYFDDVVYLTKVNNKLKMFSSNLYSNNVITGSRTGKQVEKETSRGLIELFE